MCAGGVRVCGVCVVGRVGGSYVCYGCGVFQILKKATTFFCTLQENVRPEFFYVCA